MSFKSQISLLSIVVLLLASAWRIREDQLWSQIGNFTVPWFCSALALALLIVLLVCALRGQAPGDLPWLVVILTFAAVGVVLVMGAEVDNETYHLQQIVGTRWEMAGFLGILAGLFLVTRRTPRA